MLKDEDLISFDQFEAAIFDLDGTLVHSEHVWDQAKREILASYGITPSQSLLDKHVGRGLNGFLDDVFEQSLSGEEYDEVRNKIGARADVLLPELSLPVEGAAEYLSALHVKGVRIAICSSSPERHIQSAIDRLSLQSQVELYVSGSDLPRGKPDPLPYQTTLQRLGLSASKACAFEDSAPGAESALAAGLTVFGIGVPIAGTEFPKRTIQVKCFRDLPLP